MFEMKESNAQQSNQSKAPSGHQIYKGTPYLSAVDVTDRRSVKSFHSSASSNYCSDDVDSARTSRNSNYQLSVPQPPSSQQRVRRLSFADCVELKQIASSSYNDLQKFKQINTSCQQLANNEGAKPALPLLTVRSSSNRTLNSEQPESQPLLNNDNNNLLSVAPNGVTLRRPSNISRCTSINRPPDWLTDDNMLNAIEIVSEFFSVTLN
ncbi:hypothetical protein HELRODRAFT_160597 [Helobdella robusta]|uniref:Uncharacterized protein n=1 Tax=Helobdella robusta TaxID=6412 RepID=T1EQG8_HELRO|nr:hypothetical protein HELRODRAFT_160597 [Helobdella robusta]ESO06428.1 hypothetical protein HELRODRAFT_160597 [Helobdella robusta]